MKTLILHIGMHKTGTSSIQATLRDFDDGSTRFLQLGPENHSIPIYTLFSRFRHRYHVHLREGLGPEQIDRYAEAARERLLRELALDRQTLVISGEDISVLRPGEVARLQELLAPHVDRIRVIAYVRDPLSFCSSAFQQTVKGGRRDLVMPRPRYVFRFGKFQRQFGHEAVELVPFDRDSFPGGSVVADFCSRVGIPSDRYQELRINESLSATATRLIHVLNHLERPSLGSNDLSQARHRCVEWLTTAFPGPGFRLPPALIASSVQPGELRWLARHGIRFEIERNTAPGDSDLDAFVREMACIEPPELDHLRDCMRRDNIAFAAEAGLPGLVEAVFDEMHRRVLAEAPSALDQIAEVARHPRKLGTAFQRLRDRLSAIRRRLQPQKDDRAAPGASPDEP